MQNALSYTVTLKEHDWYDWPISFNYCKTGVFFLQLDFSHLLLSCLICFDWTYMSKSHISPLCKVKNTPFFLRLFPNHKNQDQQHLFGLSYLCTPASSHHKLQARPCLITTPTPAPVTHTAKPFHLTEPTNLFDPFTLGKGREEPISGCRLAHHRAAWSRGCPATDLGIRQHSLYQQHSGHLSS